MFVLSTQNILLIPFYWFSNNNSTDESWSNAIYLVLFLMVLYCKNITNVFGSMLGSVSDGSIVEIFCYAFISTNVQHVKWNEFMVKWCVLNSNET